MVCRFVGSNYRDKVELCLIMELNDSFNFSAFDAWLIIKQHRDNAKNVSEATEIILIIIYCTLIFLGVLSNVVVSFVVARRPQMHTARNLYIVNLTVSDLTLCMICMPFTLVHIINRHWTLGVALCKLVPFVQGTNIMVSVGTITVIALDRYFTIVRGQDGPTTRRRVIISIIAVWALSMLTTMPVLFFQVQIPEHYTYRYQVSDKDTGMYKEHAEFRMGGVVHGSLSVVKNDSRFDVRYKGLPRKGWDAFVNQVTPAWMFKGQVAHGLPLPSQAASRPPMTNQAFSRSRVLNQAFSRPPVSSQAAPRPPVRNWAFPRLLAPSRAGPRRSFLSHAAPGVSNQAKATSRHPFLGKPSLEESLMGQAVPEVPRLRQFPLGLLGNAASRHYLLTNAASGDSLLGQAAPPDSQQGHTDSSNSLVSHTVSKDSNFIQDIPRYSRLTQSAPDNSIQGKATPERQRHKQAAPDSLLEKTPPEQTLLVKTVPEGQGQKQAARGVLLHGNTTSGSSLHVKAASGSSLHGKTASGPQVPHHKSRHSYQNLKELETRHRLFYNHNHYHINEKSSRGK